MPKYIIEARSPLFERIGAIEQYTRFDAVIRFNDVGTWTLVIDGGLPESALITEGGGIVVWSDMSAQPLLSGPVKSITREWSVENPTGLVTFTGKTDEQWLYERVIYPNPALAVGSQDKDRETGSKTAGAALSYFVDKNLGPGALTSRIHPYLTVDTSNLGPTINLSARFDVLAEYLQQIATTGGLGYRVLQEGSGIRFQIYDPANRSDTAVFSTKEGNMADYKYTVSAPEAATLLVAAQGEGKFRWIKSFAEITSTVEMVNDNDPRITYDDGAWYFQFNRGLGDYGNDAHFSNTLGATVTFQFIGTGIAFISEKFTDMGKVEIYIDNILAATKDCGNFGPRESQVVIYENLALAYGSHTITVKNIQTGKLILADAFRITTLPFQNGSIEWYSLNAEKFADRRDIPVSKATDGSPIDPASSLPVFPDILAQLDQAGIEALFEASATASLSVTPIDTDNLKFGRDYQLGDIVSVDIDGTLLTDVLREVRLTDDITDGPRAVPTVGTSDAGETPALYKQIRKLRQSIKKLEARL